MDELQLHTYAARLTRDRKQPIYDADTIYVDIDLGLRQWIHNEPIRLYGIDAPEVRGEEREEGKLARDILRKWMSHHAFSEFFIRTHKPSTKEKKGKYGRWLATVIVPIGEEVPISFPDRYETAFCGHNLLSINDLLVECGYAEYVDY